MPTVTLPSPQYVHAYHGGYGIGRWLDLDGHYSHRDSFPRSANCEVKGA